MKGHIPAGGPKSRNVVEPRIRTGSGAREARPAAAAQIGGNYGNHTTNKGETNWRPGPLYGGKGFNPVPYGNAKALDVEPGGCGTGRTIYKTGVLGTHGQPASANQPAKNHDILRDFGPDYRK
jgi:hypothetical protein